jgi:hypothetical protein
MTIGGSPYGRSTRRGRRYGSVAVVEESEIDDMRAWTMRLLLTSAGGDERNCAVCFVRLFLHARGEDFDRRHRTPLSCLLVSSVTAPTLVKVHEYTFFPGVVRTIANWASHPSGALRYAVVTVGPMARLEVQRSPLVVRYSPPLAGAQPREGPGFRARHRMDGRASPRRASPDPFGSSL